MFKIKKKILFIFLSLYLTLNKFKKSYRKKTYIINTDFHIFLASNSLFYERIFYNILIHIVSF